jgi:tetratricopeptide (TPR) repeat protein
LYSSAYLSLKDYPKVIDLINDFEARNGNHVYNTLAANLAAAYALNGDPTKSGETLRPVEEDAKTSAEAAYRLSLAYADMGRNDDAIRLLQRCVEARDDRLMWIKVEPRFEP